MISGKLSDRVVFERQIQQQLPRLYRIARGLSNHTSDAEDLVHDSCVKALSSFGKSDFADETSFNAWLKRILINTFRDQYRRAVRSPIRPIEHHATSDEAPNVVELVASTEPSPVESMQNSDSSNAIHIALSMLPPEVRVVSVLFLISGHSYKEIATITACPIGTVMSRLARGRQKLKDQLYDYNPRGKATDEFPDDKSSER